MIIGNEILARVRGMCLAFAVFVTVQTAIAQGVSYFTPGQPVYYGGGPVSRDIDITGTGNPDFILYSDGVGAVNLFPQGNNSVIVAPVPPPNIGSFVAALNQGDVVGTSASSLNPAFAWHSAADEPTGASTLANQNSAGADGYFYSKTAYIGFDLIQAGQNYYGWMEVQNPLPVASGSIVQWAYSTSPNTPILAGGGLVPEPASWALLAVGAVLFALRRRLVRARRQLLGLLLLLPFAPFSHAQGSRGFYTTLTQIPGAPPAEGGNSASPFLFLSYDELFGNFSTADKWLASIQFPATGSDPPAVLQLAGPIDSIYQPIDGIGGGESIAYGADFFLTDGEQQALLAGQAQLVLTQDIISIDPSFQPQVFQGAILPVPEPGASLLLIVSAPLLLAVYVNRRSRT